jgi:TnpA family transposase
LSREDFDIIFRKRSDHSRLGFALLLCYLRYPGRVLGADEIPPVALVSFIARQLGVNPTAFARYSQRDQTRREQLAELMERLGYLSFDRANFRYYLAWLTPIAQNIRRADLLVEMLAISYRLSAHDGAARSGIGCTTPARDVGGSGDPTRICTDRFDALYVR